MQKTIMALGLSSTIAAAALISGTIIDQKGAPIEGVSVTYSVEKTVTNASGLFQLGQSTGFKKRNIAKMKLLNYGLQLKKRVLHLQRVSNRSK